MLVSVLPAEQLLLGSKPRSREDATLRSPAARPESQERPVLAEPAAAKQAAVPAFPRQQVSRKLVFLGSAFLKLALPVWAAVPAALLQQEQRVLLLPELPAWRAPGRPVSPLAGVQSQSWSS